jgi:uncharacterized protein
VAVLKIGIIGATGRVGSRVLSEAKDRGHLVTAIVRDPVKLSDQHITVINKDIFELTESDLASFDVVVNAFGAPLGQAHLHMKVAEHLAALLRGKERPRLMVVGGAGSLTVDENGMLLMDTPDFPPVYKSTAVAQGEVLNFLRQERGLNWTFLSPSALFEPGERTGKFRAGGNNLLVDAQGLSHISMEDYAIALVDEIEHPQHIRERFTVGY